jgi:hypothetical protein
MQIRDLPMDRNFAISKLQILVEDEEPVISGFAQSMLAKLEKESESESLERRLRELHERFRRMMERRSKKES